MDEWQGRPMTVALVSGSIFRVNENAFPWLFSWVVKRESPAVPRPTDINVITPAGVYRGGATVVKRSDNSGAKYRILRIQDAIEKVSASGYVACIRPATGPVDQATPASATAPGSADSTCPTPGESVDLANLVPSN